MISIPLSAILFACIIDILIDVKDWRNLKSIFCFEKKKRWSRKSEWKEKKKNSSFERNSKKRCWKENINKENKEKYEWIKKILSINIKEQSQKIKNNNNESHKKNVMSEEIKISRSTTYTITKL